MSAEGRLSAEELEDFASILKALAHPVRLMIVEELLRNPRCVTAIHEIIDVRQPNISQHLTVLKSAGIVASNRDGSYQCYYLSRPDQIKSILETLSFEWPEADLEETKKRFQTALTERLKSRQSTDRTHGED